MKTAMQEVAQKILDIDKLTIQQVRQIASILSWGMDKEKEHIIDTFVYGKYEKDINAEQYYNETFN